ncbi:MAG TPA: glycosyltransferase family 2 protein [Candidatus Binataceae bacterium]|nr:glycosyltransferase family 2 protein [Candidatus Binataceae bacterium]
MPLPLSIGLPTYNRAEHLDQMLASLVPQLDQRCELLIADDASSDATAQVIARYAAGSARIGWRQNAHNLGLDRNSLGLLEQAHGDYFWLCADDDIVLPGTVEKIYRALGHGPFSVLSLNTYVFRGRDYRQIYSRWAGLPAHGLERFERCDDHLRRLSFRLSFAPGNIINGRAARAALIEPGLREFIGLGAFGFAYLYVVLAVLSGAAPSALLREPCIAQRWVDEGRTSLLTFGYTLPRLLEAFVGRGCSRGAVRRVINHGLLRQVLPALLYVRLGGDAQEPLREMRGLLLRGYRRYPLFWLLVAPALIFPTSSLRPLFPLLRTLRRRWEGVQAWP